MIRITDLARVASIGLVAAAVWAAPGYASTGARVTPDNRPHRTGPASMVIAPTPVTPDNRAERTGPQAMPVVVVQAATGGFSWTDAGIGAAAMLGLGLSVVGIAIAVRRPKPSTLRV